jgi:hypothetical protein
VLTAPAANAVAGGTITIEGRADGPALARWSLEWGEGAAPTQWQPLATGGPAPGARSLASWASGDRGGVHTLRLQAHLRDGRTLEVRSRINLDNIAPVAWITYPGPATILSGLTPGERFPLQAEAQDNTTVAAMLFYGDGRLLGRRDSGPWTLMVDAATLGPGTHHLSVIAVDLAGNRSLPAEVQVSR